MNAKRIGIILLVLATLLALVISVVGAQDNPGNGNGNGNGSGQSNGNRYGQGNRNENGNRFGPANGNGYQGGQNPDAAFSAGLHQNLPAAAVDVLPQEVVDLMIDGWLDEHQAYAIYGSLIDEFGSLRPFVNLQRSEMQHISAWEFLFTRYGIEVPVVPAFDLPAFDNMTEACTAGATVEVANFDLYDSMLAAFEPYPDLLQVAQSLRDASEFNHLPALERCAGL